jgi:hypothetical protein
MLSCYEASVTLARIRCGEEMWVEHKERQYRLTVVNRRMKGRIVGQSEVRSCHQIATCPSEPIV